MWEAINSFLSTVDDLVWGVPLMVLIMAGGILLTARLGLLQIRRLPLALKWMFKNEEEGDGEISSFAALCTALSATIGTGNIVGVATAVCAIVFTALTADALIHFLVSTLGLNTQFFNIILLLSS